MAKFSFKIVVFLALFLLTESGAILDKKVGEDEEEMGKRGIIVKLLMEAEAKTSGLAKDAMELERAVSEDQLKCIPCGAACISSRNCCRRCYCLIKWEIVIPRCVVKKPSNFLD